MVESPAGPPALPPPSWWPGLLERVEDRLGHQVRDHPAGGHTVAGRRSAPATPVLVAVDGRSGAGKTDLARAAADLLAGAGHPTHVVQLDSLCPGWSGLARALPRLCEEVVAPLRSGRPGRFRSWDWHSGRPGPWVDVPPRPVVLVEGVGVLAGPCAASFHVRLWLEAPSQVRRIRALARDGEVFAPHWQQWAEQEEAVLAGRPPSDAVVDTVTGRTRWSDARVRSRPRTGSTGAPRCDTLDP